MIYFIFLKSKKKKRENKSIWYTGFFIFFSSKNPGKENIMVYTNILSNTCY